MRLILILLLAGVIGIAGWIGARTWHPSLARYPVQGIDVSAATGPLDWNALAANGADFGYAVATIGARDRDPSFEGHWRAMSDAGLRRGAIHVFSLCQDALEQADAFNTVVPREPASLPAAVALDYQQSCATRPDRPHLVASLRAFLARVETHTGKPMLLLLARAMERDYQVSAAIPRGLWVRGNFFRPRYPSRPWRMWRATDLRRVEGAAGPVNWDVVIS